MGVFLDAPWAGESFAPPTSLGIEPIESAVIRQLQSAIVGIEISHYPDRPETYRLTHPVGAVLVRYDGAVYGELEDCGAVVQTRRMRFTAKVLVRDLGWSVGGPAGGPSPGAYAVLDSARAGLTGFQIPGCTKIRLLRDRFVERDKQGAVWVYEIAFELNTVAVEPSSPTNYPLFVKGVVEDRGDVTTDSLSASAFTFDANGQINLPFGNVRSLRISDFATGIPYVEGLDYSVDTVNGIIAALPTGSLSPGETVSVASSFSESVTVVSSGGSSPTAPTN